MRTPTGSLARASERVATPSPARLARLDLARRVAPFAAVALLGLGALFVPEPNRSAADAPAVGSAVVAAGQAEGAPLEAAAVEALAPADSPIDGEVDFALRESGDTQDQSSFRAPARSTPATPNAFADEPSPTTTTTTTPSFADEPAPSTTSAVAARPLKISDFGWSSATGAGTPAGSAGVPEKSLPVGSGAAGPEKVSWFRLTGDAAPLVLRPVQDAGSNRAETTATMRLCRSKTSDWATGPNLAANNRPPVDDASCVDGKRNSDGSWSFEVAKLGAIDDPRGAVLIPGAGVFQVVFALPS